MEKQERFVATELVMKAVGDLGLRQDWIADQLSIPRSTLSRVLRGIRPTDKATAERISGLVRVPFFVGWKLPNSGETTQERVAA